MDVFSEIAELKAENIKLNSQLQSLSIPEIEIAVRNQITANTNALTQLYGLISTSPAAATFTSPKFSAGNAAASLYSIFLLSLYFFYW